MLYVGDWGFEVRAFGLAVRVYLNDVELGAGPYAVTLLPDGVYLRGRSCERSWHWFDARAWFSNLLSNST